MLEDRFQIDPSGKPTLRDPSPIKEVFSGDPGENAGIDGSGVNGVTANHLSSQSLGVSQTPLLKFPLIDNPAYSAKMSFKVYRLKPADADLSALFDFDIFDNVKGYIKSAGETVANVFTSDPGEGGDPAPVEADEQAALDARANEAARQAQDNKKAQADSVRAILSGLNESPVLDAPRVDLYFPLSVQIDDTVDIGTGNLGGLGVGILKGVENNEKLGTAVANSVSSGFQNIFDFALGGLNKQTAQYVANKMAKAGPQGIQTAVSVATQTAINPHTRAVFNQVNLRQFSFTFKFIPASADEAREVQKIIKHFRSQMYPELLEVGSDGVTLPLGYKYPNLFKITFKHRGSEAKIPRLEMCYLRGVQSSYNPTGQAFYRDGQPNEIDMTLQFQEFRTLSREDIEKGF